MLKLETFIGTWIVVLGGMLFAFLLAALTAAFFTWVGRRVMGSLLFLKGLWPAYAQIARTHRLYFTWAIEQVSKGGEVLDWKGDRLDLHDIANALETWDKDDLYKWREPFDRAMRAWPRSVVGKERVKQLEDAIRAHRSQKASDRCIEDDNVLYAVLRDGVLCDRRVGDKDAMLVDCKRFIENRCEGGGWLTYVEVEKQRNDLMVALSGFLGAPVTWDEATIPNAGIMSAPEQVVGNMSVSFLRIRCGEKLIADVEASIEKCAKPLKIPVGEHHDYAKPDGADSGVNGLD